MVLFLCDFLVKHDSRKSNVHVTLVFVELKNLNLTETCFRDKAFQIQIATSNLILTKIKDHKKFTLYTVIQNKCMCIYYINNIF